VAVNTRNKTQNFVGQGKSAGIGRGAGTGQVGAKAGRKGGPTKALFTNCSPSARTGKSPPPGGPTPFVRSGSKDGPRGEAGGPELVFRVFEFSGPCVENLDFQGKWWFMGGAFSKNGDPPAFGRLPGPTRGIPTRPKPQPVPCFGCLFGWEPIGPRLGPRGGREGGISRYFSEECWPGRRKGGNGQRDKESDREGPCLSPGGGGISSASSPGLVREVGKEKDVSPANAWI